jgi:outer membrane protein assembly factor BamC
VRLVRDGSARWLELGVDARELWLALKDFFTQLGYQIARDEPLLGVIETEWRNVTQESPGGIGGLVADFFSASAAQPRERFRLRVERITDADKPVRLFVTQRRIVPAVVVDARGRPIDERVLIKRLADKERETEMLLRLLVHLGVQEQTANGMLTSDEVERLAARAYLEEVGEQLTLVVAETHHRVWTLAGQAIEEIGLDIENTVKSESRYEVLFEGVPPAGDVAQDDEDQQQQGFFSGLFDDEGEIEQYYQVYVLEEPGVTRITIADATGSSKLPALEKEILQRLHEQLR